MMPEQNKPAGNHEFRTHRHPKRCVECGRKEVQSAVITYSVQKNHDGRVYDLEIIGLHVTKCDHCGEVYLGGEADDQISAALRTRLGLLSPEEIRANLKSLGLSQKDFAEALGVAAESVSRWLTGAMIQSRLADNAMRWFFGIPAVRAAAACAHLVHAEAPGIANT